MYSGLDQTTINLLNEARDSAKQTNTTPSQSNDDINEKIKNLNIVNKPKPEKKDKKSDKLKRIDRIRAKLKPKTLDSLRNVPTQPDTQPVKQPSMKQQQPQPVQKIGTDFIGGNFVGINDLLDMLGKMKTKMPPPPLTGSEDFFREVINDVSKPGSSMNTHQSDLARNMALYSQATNQYKPSKDDFDRNLDEMSYRWGGEMGMDKRETNEQLRPFLFGMMPIMEYRTDEWNT